MSTNHMTKHETLEQIYRLAESVDMVSGYLIKANAARIIRRNAATLNTLSERECNGVTGPDGYAKWDDGDQAKTDKRRITAKKAIRLAIKVLVPEPARNRLTVEFQGDPRGAPVSITLDDRERFVVFY